MKKLRLDPEMLRVQSFTAEIAASAARGTVQARAFNSIDAPGDTDLDILTCAGSCPPDCF